MTDAAAPQRQTSAQQLAAWRARVAAAIADDIRVLLTRGGDRRELGRAAGAALADAALGTRDGARAALSQLQSVSGLVREFAGDHQHAHARKVAAEIQAEQPRLETIVGGWVDATTLPTLAVSPPGDIAASPDVPVTAQATLALSADAPQPASGTWAISGEQPGDLSSPAQGGWSIPQGSRTAVVPVTVPAGARAGAGPLELSLAVSAGAGVAAPFPGPVRFRVLPAGGPVGKATVDWAELIGQVRRLPDGPATIRPEVRRSGSTKDPARLAVEVAGLPAGVLTGCEPADFGAGQERSTVTMTFSPAGQGARDAAPLSGRADLTATADLDPGPNASQAFSVVAGQTPPPPPPTGEDGMAPPFPDPTETGYVEVTNLAGLVQAFASLPPGHQLVVNPGVVQGGLVLARKGLRNGGTDQRPDAPLVARVGAISGGRFVELAGRQFVTVAGPVKTAGDYTWLRGFLLKGGVDVPAGATGNRFSRSQFTLEPFSDTGTATGLDWCEFVLIGDEFLQHHAADGCRRPFVYRCYFHEQGSITGKGPVGTFHSIGKTFVDDQIEVGARVLECLYGHGVSAGEGAEMKSSRNVVWRCASQDVGATGGKHKIPRTVVRHGRDDKILSCYTEATGVPGCIGARGADNIIADCVAPKGGNIGPFSGSNTYAGWRKDRSKGAYPIGEGTILCRIANPHIGGGPSSGTMPPVGTILEDCTGTVATEDGAAYTRRPNTRDYYAEEGLPGPDLKPARPWPVEKMGPAGTWAADD